MEKNAEKSKSALREEEVLRFWKDNKIFEKSLEKESPMGEYVFYEGPPTANGKPGIHHLEARAFKDVIPRYKTMKGYHVRRKGGWDTHGLPVELQVEKKLGLTSKKAIEEFGIAKFNQECKESVWEYTDLWEKFTERIGYWVDQENPYVTYHNNYIESVWNVIKETEKQGLLFKDYKIVPWCPRCGTTLSSHELAQGYIDVKDLSVYAKFKIKGIENTYILAWTTTPWTLPGNVALAVGKKIIYVKIQKENDILIISKDKINLIEGEYKILEELKGGDLIGLEYEPLYPYLIDTITDSEKAKLNKAFRIYDADFVTTNDGTGVVHTAVMYGQDDFELGNNIGLPKHHMVGLDGKFLPGTDFLTGRFVRDEEVAVDIIKDLAHRGLLFKKEKYEHSYPHCWRCKTGLIYYARDSWYIRMSSLKDKLIKENESINWEPSHIKNGRFGEWLKDIKDWAISRERYWGTPLPVWECNSCNKVEVLGSIDEIKNKTKKSGNRYFIMRHGEADNNLTDTISISYNNESHLTELGKKQVFDSSQTIKKEKIDLLYSSPFSRTLETSNIVADTIGLDKDSIIIDDRLHEISLPMYEGKSWKDYNKELLNENEDFFYESDGVNETHNELKKRTMNFIYDVEKTQTNKNILIVTHGGPAWLSFAGAKGKTGKEILSNIEKFDSFKNAEIRELNFTCIPHNENYELDLHKPFIDEIELVCSCGGELIREKEVMDVWLDSGTMPFSQDHYPFENKELVEGPGYPADFISEAIDQTRGWFYTLHAVGVLMGRGKAYKNVICLGLLLDANGKKMSKSVGNVVDPWDMMNKYGVDTLRLWMYAVNQPGDSKNFDEKTVSDLHNKVFNLLYNVLVFYELYRDKKFEDEIDFKNSDNILDKWILAKLNLLIESVTINLENYKLLEPVRAIREFIDDLSTWYVRRSRERLKDGDIDAKRTLYFVLKNIIKLMAPFTPFASEDIWQKIKNKKDLESVHLIKWPVFNNLNKLENEKIVKDMAIVREIVTLGLKERQNASIPVRQPLNKIEIFFNSLNNDYIEILKDELNIKEIIFKDGIELAVKIDTHLTEELRLEGKYRELVRAIQDLRKKKGLNPNDEIKLDISTSVDGQMLINKFKENLIKSVGATELNIKENNGTEVLIDDLIFNILFV